MTLANGVKGVGTLSIVDRENDTAHAFAISRNITLNPNFTQEVVYAADELGTDVPIQTVLTQQDPQLQITFPRKSVESMAIVLDRKWGAEGAVPGVQYNRVITPTTNTIAALGAGFEGEGILADVAGAVLGAKIGEHTVKATQVNEAAFLATNTAEFSVGADGLIQITNDLVGNPVSFRVPYALANARLLGEERFLNLSLTVTLVLDDLNLVQIQFDSAQVVLDQSTLNFGESTVQATFRANFTGERCTAYDIISLGKRRRCVRQ